MLVIPCVFLNRKTEGIILNNYSPRQVASDTWKIVTCSPALNLKPSAKKFEEGITVKMINERIIKALLNSKIIYSFKLIYSHGLLSRATSFSMFLLRNPKTFF